MSRSSAGREHKEQKPTETLSQRADRLNQEAAIARNEVALAEQKVALGIQYLYDQHRNEAKFDAQGIATLTLEAKELNQQVAVPFSESPIPLRDLFPNRLENGVKIHLFAEHYIPHPPAFYMIQQKIGSLCQAATRAPFNVDADFASGLMAMYDGIITSKLNTLVHEIYGDNGITQTDAAKEKRFHDGVDQLIRQYAEEAVQKLRDEAKQNPGNKNAGNFHDFSKALLENSSHHRSDTHDILTLDSQHHRFSYDEAASVTAHDRNMGTGCANLSLVFEGRYQAEAKEAPAIVTSSTVKHATPVAIDAIGKAPKTDLLIDTYRNLEQVITTMVRLRQHGRTADQRNDAMTINWVYQMLTTNAFDLDNQAKTYDYVTRAARLLNQGTLEISGISVNVSLGVMNAGINKFADVGSGGGISSLFSKVLQKADTQRRENRNAFLQLSDAVGTLSLSAHFPDNVKTAFTQLKDYLQPHYASQDPKMRDACDKLQTVRKELAENSIKMHNCNETLKRMLEEPESTRRNAQIEKFKESVESLDKTATKLYDDLRRYTDIIEKQERLRWFANQTTVNQQLQTLSNYINNPAVWQSRLANPAAQAETLRDLCAMTALIYKTYANHLYYGNHSEKYEEVYRNPEKAALFNAYLIQFQHLTGMMASFGCKSANDRTLVIREMVAALSHLLHQQPLAAPEAFHQSALSENTHLSGLLSSMIMVNSALYSAINDTSGATSKVDADKFPFLSGVHNVDLIGDFGENYAAHKMKMHEPVATKTIDTGMTTPAARAAMEMAAMFSKQDQPSQTRTSKTADAESDHTPPSPRTPGSRSRSSNH